MHGKKLKSDISTYKHAEEVHNFSAAREILPYLLGLKNIKSVLDVGCGLGTWLAVALELGVEEITGIDGVNLSQEQLKITADNFIHADLSVDFDLGKKFDLVICLEVAEHLPAGAARTLVNNLTRHSNFVLFSAAVPGQDGQDHLNEQWPQYWGDLFTEKKYYGSDFLRQKFWDNAKVEWWYRQNMVMFIANEINFDIHQPLTDKLLPIIHPELFKEKLRIIEEQHNVIRKEIWQPTMTRSLKSLFKSFFK